MPAGTAALCDLRASAAVGERGAALLIVHEWDAGSDSGEAVPKSGPTHGTAVAKLGAWQAQDRAAILTGRARAGLGDFETRRANDLFPRGVRLWKHR